MFDRLLRPWDPNPPSISEAEATLQKNLVHLSINLFNEYQDKPSLVARLPRDMIFRLMAVAAYRCPKALGRRGLLRAFFAAAHRDDLKLYFSFPLCDPAPLDNAPTGHVNCISTRSFNERLVQEKMVTSSAISQVNIGHGRTRVDGSETLRRSDRALRKAATGEYDSLFLSNRNKADHVSILTAVVPFEA